VARRVCRGWHRARGAEDDARLTDARVRRLLPRRPPQRALAHAFHASSRVQRLTLQGARS
jgi:hypothetical protein